MLLSDKETKEFYCLYTKLEKKIYVLKQILSNFKEEELPLLLQQKINECSELTNQIHKIIYENLED